MPDLTFFQAVRRRPLLLLVVPLWKVIELWQWMFGFLGFWLFVALRSVTCWMTSRPVRQLAMGLPAVLVAGGTIAVLVIAKQTSRHKLVGKYNEAVVRASNKEDWKAADLYLQKIAYLNDFDPATQFRLALAAERQGDLPRARELISHIAQTNAPNDTGYSAAHMWLATDLVKNQSPLDAPKLAQYERHLQQALAGSPDDRQANQLLGDLYAREGKLAEAAFHLQKVVKDNPDVLLPLARIYALLNRKSQARALGEQASAHFQKLAESADQSDLSARYSWAQAEFFLRNWDQAAAILQAGLKVATVEEETKRFRLALADVFVHWYDALSRESAKDLARRLELLQQALSFAPENPVVLNRLAAFAVLKQEGKDEAMQLLHDVLTKGRAPATVHFILGTAALDEGENAAAIQHLELAFEQLPEMAAVANNLAWALAYAQEPELNRAEQLIEAAAKLAPQHPEIRETRGQIRSKIGRTKDAILDLEYALQSFPDRIAIHETLANLYEQVGDHALAASHKRLAKTNAD